LKVQIEDEMNLLPLRHYKAEEAYRRMPGQSKALELLPSERPENGRNGC
jgi:hypothetical protein